MNENVNTSTPSTSVETLAVIMKNENVKQDELIERVKTQTEQLWDTIQEAKKSNLKIQVGFEDYLVKPEIEITKSVFSQTKKLTEMITASS